MGITTTKGDLAEGMVLADLIKRGHGVALPMGSDYPFDLLLLRNRGLKIERIQVKHGLILKGALIVKCESSSKYVQYRYTDAMIDWIAIYEPTTDTCYYVPSSLLGPDGRRVLHLRINDSRNMQVKNIRFAKDYMNI